MTEGPATVVAELSAVDDLSGVEASGSLHYRGPSEQWISASAQETSCTGSNPEVVTFPATFTFPESIEFGIWKIKWVPLEDIQASLSILIL